MWKFGFALLVTKRLFITENNKYVISRERCKNLFYFERIISISIFIFRNIPSNISQSLLLCDCTPLFSLLRWSISAWSFSRVSLCCSCRNRMFLSRDVTRGSPWSFSTGAAALIPAWVNDITGSGFKCWLIERRVNPVFPCRGPTLLQCGRWCSGGKLLPDILPAPGGLWNVPIFF